MRTRSPLLRRSETDGRPSDNKLSAYCGRTRPNGILVALLYAQLNIVLKYGGPDRIGKFENRADVRMVKPTNDIYLAFDKRFD